MNQTLKPDSTYWDIFEHIESVSKFVETIGSLSAAKAALFGLLFLIPLLAAFVVLLKQFHIPDKNKKWYFIGFIIVYAGILFYVTFDTKRTFENYSLKKRVLNEMVYRLTTEVPAQSLCYSLTIIEPDLSGLSKREPTHFHYRKNEKSKGMFSVVHKNIIAVINQKKKDLEESLAAQEIISIDSIQALATKTGFGDVSDIVIEDIISKNDKLIYTDEYRVVELKKSNLVQFAELPNTEQLRIAAAKFDQDIFLEARAEYSSPKNSNGLRPIYHAAPPNLEDNTPIKNQRNDKE